MENTNAEAPVANDEAVQTAVVQSLTTMLSHDAGTVSSDTRLFEDLAFDSTSVLELLMSLENELDLEFDPETLEPQDFATVRSLVEYIQKQQREQ